MHISILVLVYHPRFFLKSWIHESSTQNQEGQSHFSWSCSGTPSLLVALTSWTKINSPEGVSKSQHHIPPDPGPDILEQIEWMASQADSLKNDTTHEKLRSISDKDKNFNDLAISLAKKGPISGKLWPFDPLRSPVNIPDTPTTGEFAVTHSQAAGLANPIQQGCDVALVDPAFLDDKLITLQTLDSAIRKLICYWTDLINNEPSDCDLNSVLDLHAL